jgi:hypothetical protein
MLTVTSRNPFYGIAGAQAPESVVVRVVDADGEGVPDRAVSFTVISGGGHLSLVNGRSDSRGYVSTAWTLGASPDPQQGRAQLTDGPSDTPAAADALPLTRELIAVPVQASAEASAMLGTLGWYLPWARATLAGNLPRNPGIAQHIEAKMALLATPGLGSDIVSEKRVVEGEVLTATRAIPLAAMFPVEAMRADAQQSITVMQETVPILEQFLVAFPTARVRLWHGFIIGNSGGGGGLNMEDRASWAARGVTLPYDAVIAHELAHSYVGNGVPLPWCLAPSRPWQSDHGVRLRPYCRICAVGSGKLECGRCPNTGYRLRPICPTVMELGRPAVGRRWPSARLHLHGDRQWRPGRV